MNWKLLALLSAALTSQAFAEEVTQGLSVGGIPLSGRLFTDIYAPAEDFGDDTYRQVSTSLWLQGEPRLNESSFARFTLTLDAFDTNVASPGVTSSTFRTQLREGYAAYFKNGFELRAGRQLIPWGKVDVINPTDVLSAFDYTFFNPDNEVRRVGATSILFSWTPAQGNSPWNLTVVATPVFPQTVLLVPPELTPANVSISGTPILPPRTLANTETAFKLAYTGSGWDASVMAFRGWNHTPEYTLTGLSLFPALSASVAPTFHRIRAVGGDFSFTQGRWIFRAESTYKWTENNDGLQPTIIPSHWDAVASIERPLGEDFRIQGQFVYRYFPRYVAPEDASGPDPITAMANAGVAEANALLLGYQFKSRITTTLRLGYVNETAGVDADVFVVFNIQGGDYLVRPKFSYHVTDALLATVGMDYYGGPNNRQLGALKVFNSLFAEAKYSF